MENNLSAVRLRAVAWRVAIGKRVRALLRFIPHLAYVVAVVGITFGSVYYLDANDLPVILARLANNSLNYWVASVQMTLVLIAFNWRFDFKLKEAFDDAEKVPYLRIAAVLGVLWTFGYVAGAIFG